MGTRTVTTMVYNLARDQALYEAQFMVDTGAIDCLVPEGALQAAGIKIEGKDIYALAKGALVEYDYGYAVVNFMGTELIPLRKHLKKMSAKPLK